MVSTYGYIAQADLESYTGQDYSAINTKYTDAMIDARISAAEEIINGVTGTSFSGTIPDGIKAATKMIASKLMFNQLLDDGYLDPQTQKTRYSDADVLNPQLIQILQPYISENSTDTGLWIING